MTSSRLAPGTRVRLPGGAVAFASPDIAVGRPFDGTYRTRTPGSDVVVRGWQRDQLTPEALTVETLDETEILALELSLSQQYDPSTREYASLIADCDSVIDCSASRCLDCGAARARIVAHLTAKPRDTLAGEEG